jgi:tetratricopeptide (TPR) repeat protein
MDAEELDRRHRTSDGWLPCDVATALVEHGHLELVRREAERGDFHCADALGRLLAARGEGDAAVAAYRPFAGTGWWVAVERIVGILTEQETVDAAIALVRPLAEAGERRAVVRLATLLAAQGRIDEVFRVLRPGLADSYLAGALVELTSGRGRDDEVAASLRPFADAGRKAFEGLLATVLDRQGRVDEAVGLLLASLRGGSSYYVNHAEQLADILARHDPDALAGFVAGDGGEYAAYRLADLFEEHGRVDEAVGVLSPFAVAGNTNAAGVLADLLARHGRADEAIQVLRPAAMADPECLIRPLCTLLIGQGRLDDALVVIDEVAAQSGLDPVDLRMERIEVLVEGGQTEQAIADLRADLDAAGGYARARLAELLTDAGRPDEAIAVLLPNRERWIRSALAKLLIRQGRPEEAVVVIRS